LIDKWCFGPDKVTSDETRRSTGSECRTNVDRYSGQTAVCIDVTKLERIYSILQLTWSLIWIGQMFSTSVCVFVTAGVQRINAPIPTMNRHYTGLNAGLAKIPGCQLRSDRSGEWGLQARP
jgi:hypothetical protein